MYVVGNNCFVIHDKKNNFYSYDPKDGHKSAKTVHAKIGYQDPLTRQKFILVINQAIHIDGLDYHLPCSIQCCLNGVHISEVLQVRLLISQSLQHAPVEQCNQLL